MTQNTINQACPLADRLARETRLRWMDEDRDLTWARLDAAIAAVIRTALDEAANAALGLDRGDWPVEFEHVWRSAQDRIARAIEAL